MQLGLAVGIREESEELGNALVFLGLLAAHNPERRATERGILRRARRIRVIWHRRIRPFELRIGLHVAVEARGGQHDRAFAGGEAPLAGVGAAGIIEGLVLLCLDEVIEVLHMQGRVELQLGVEAVDSVRTGCQRHVVPHRELLDVQPGDPGAREAALVIASSLELLGGGEDIRPGLRRGLGIKPGLPERIVVDPHHRRRGIEREGQHLALRGRVIARHRRQIGLRLELLARIGHQLVDRLHRPLGRHHRRRADLENLNDMRRVAGTERRDTRVHGIRIGTLVTDDDLVVLLGGVEILGELDHHVIVGASHGVPPLDLDLREGRGTRKRGKGEKGRAERATSNHENLPWISPAAAPPREQALMSAPDDTGMKEQ